MHQEWVDAIQDDWPPVWAVIEAARAASGEDMAAFLCWLGVRLLECHRVLKDTGSLYLHIDHTAHAYVKCLLDGIFGRKNFRNEVVWSYKTGGASRSNFSRKHDTILFYSLNSHYAFNLQKEKAYTKSKSRRPGIINYGSGNAEFFEDKEGVYNLVNMRDVWDISYIGSTDIERTGYPTQKPLALYERIIQASSNPGDMVLDPFCGCATTPVAAERLGRRWIGIDVWEGAYDLVAQRLNDSRQLLTEIPPEVVKLTDPPERTDYAETSPVPDLKLKAQREPEPWEKLSRADITRILSAAQAATDGVVCAGCGRELEREFMELDHITPKSGRGANHILNRILLCRPCNGRKRNHFTLIGLMAENKKAGVKWMKDEARAKLTQSKAAKWAEWVRVNFGNREYRDFIGRL